MALLNGQNVCDEVSFRISSRLPASGTGAGSIINSTNRILGMISAAASWEWEQSSGALSITAGTATTGDTAVLAGADTGKEIALFNISSGARIERVRTSDTASASSAYVNVGPGGIYNTFRLYTSGANQDPTVALYPGQSLTGSIYVYGIWHVVPPVLTYGAGTTVLWNIPAMDMLLIDWTEADIKRKLNMAGWDTLWADCIKRVSEFKVTYSSQRENTGPESEVKVMAEEKQAGRD